MSSPHADNFPAALKIPLRFTPTYQVVVWGGRRMAAWRSDLPEGPVGESWDLADQDRGMSVVAEGGLAGMSLRELTRRFGAALVGVGFRGQSFPLLVKVIDASDRLSVQVHPDDALARQMGLGENGKTECWYMAADGGTLYQGTRPGVDRAAFEAALAQGTVADTLNKFDVKAGDFFFLDARTVHALGAGCLLFEVQQSSDVTFRVFDWGRMGLDGKPRPMHVQESLETIDFSRTGFGPRKVAAENVDGGQVRRLADCPFFSVEERSVPAGAAVEIEGTGRCAIVCCLSGGGVLSTGAGSVQLQAMSTVLVPAAAGAWSVMPGADATKFLLAYPKFN